MAGNIKNNYTIGNNVIIGENSIIYLFHRTDKNTLLEEIQKHSQSGTFIQILEDVATRGLEATGLKIKRDTHSKGQGKNAVYEWSKVTNGGPRLYLDVSDFDGKRVYIIYSVGNKCSQDNDFNKAYNRRNQIKKEGIDIHAEIEQEMNEIQLRQNTRPVPPRVVAHHYGQAQTNVKKNKHQRQKAG